MLLLEEKFTEKYQALANSSDRKMLVELVKPYNMVSDFRNFKAFAEEDEGEASSIKLINVVGLLGSDAELGTTYQSIINDIQAANENPAISEIVLNVNSPGGSANGIMPAMLAVKGSQKKITSVVNDSAASAAYMLATQSNKILALHELSTVGSVGVVAEMLDTTKALESQGIEIKTFTNSDSPFKRVDANTDEGAQAIISELDDVYNIMETQIAAGRDVTKDFVKSNFGKGRMLTAENAVNSKMIDGILNKNSFVNDNVEAVKMEKELLASDKGFEVALEAERNRVESWMQFVEVDAKMVRDGVLSGKSLDLGKAAILAQRQAVTIASAVEDNPKEVAACSSVESDLKAVEVKKEFSAKSLAEATKEILAKRRAK